MELELTFTNDLDPTYDDLKEHFIFLANRVFAHLKLDNYFIFEVNLVDRKTIHELNKTYRQVDRETDVISFAFEDNVKEIDSSLPRVLGEIFICIDVAKDQALAYKHSFKREVSFLFVHGLLHLLSYDHMKKEDEEVMFKLQDEILDPLKL